MPTICPTISADHPAEYRAQVERVEPFASRLHIDLTDGVFAQPRSLGPEQVFWPEHMPVDLHVMYQKPFVHAQALATLLPQMIIVHAEADGNFLPFAMWLHRHEIGVGLALLAETPVQEVLPALDVLDHVLVYSGNVDHQRGSIADMKLLSKVRELRARKPELEIGWEGGVNASNISQLLAAGVDCVNVGGYIHHATDPGFAYATLKSLI